MTPEIGIGMSESTTFGIVSDEIVFNNNEPGSTSIYTDHSTNTVSLPNTNRSNISNSTPRMFDTANPILINARFGNINGVAFSHWQRKKLHILVVDDSKMNRKFLIRLLLKTYNCECTEAEDGLVSVNLMKTALHIP
jgi:hypothetical protein